MTPSVEYRILVPPCLLYLTIETIQLATPNLDAACLPAVPLLTRMLRVFACTPSRQQTVLSNLATYVCLAQTKL